jgi:hypothetical protein
MRFHQIMLVIGVFLAMSGVLSWAFYTQGKRPTWTELLVIVSGSAMIRIAKAKSGQV